MIVRPLLATAALAACSSSKTSPDAATLRPGVEDSSQTYKGTPDPHESAFWTAVRSADDSGRATAVTDMTADVTADPTNGYSDFLIGASYFMPPNSVLAALANGTQPPQFQPSPDAVPHLQAGLSHLTDPFYLGFDGGLLAAMQLAGGDTTDGQATFATAAMNNRAATGFIKVLLDLQQQNPAQALADMYGLLDYCNGGALDRSGADAAAYVQKQNSGALVHRECYSGFFAPHGSSGELLVLADLQAVNGNAQAASAYFTALQGTSDYATWPLKPYVERRIAGQQPADPRVVAGIASTCGTCHTDTLP